jgi:hypothetical protein
MKPFKTIFLLTSFLSSAAMAQKPLTTHEQELMQRDYYSLFSTNFYKIENIQQKMDAYAFFIDRDSTGGCVPVNMRAQNERDLNDDIKNDSKLNDAIKMGKTRIIRGVTYSEATEAGIKDYQGALDFVRKQPECNKKELSL